MKVEYKFPLTHAMMEIGHNGDSPLTRYSNLFAEWAASPYHLWVLCEHASFSREIMTAVLYEEENLLAAEAFRLSCLFDVPLEYLFSNELVLIDGESLQEDVDGLLMLFNRITESPNSATMSDYQGSTLRSEARRLERLQKLYAATFADVSRSRNNLKELVDGLEAPTPIPRNKRLADIGGVYYSKVVK
ncbi:MAG: hypothetical protein RSF13_07205 [Clostridiales bacterium]